MVKKVLVALDPDQDTPIATRYAVAIARDHDAEVTGLALIDPEHIEGASAGGGIGSMFYAETLRSKLTERAREEAERLVRSFQEELRGAGLRFNEHVREGVLVRRMIDEMKYHDLLVIGRHPHFFYDRPEEESNVISAVVREGACPTLVVGHELRPVRRVLMAFDGSTAAAHAMQAFARLKPFGDDLALEVLHVRPSDDAETREDSELLLRLSGGYLSAHGFSPTTAGVRSGSPHRAVLDYAAQYGADLLVAGAYSQSGVRRLFFGSTSRSLLDDSPIPLFLYH